MNNNEKMYHIKAAPSDIAPYVLLPGDPHRVSMVAALWDESHFVADNREHVTYTGSYKGMPVSCTSTGMGCPSTAIAVEELTYCGANTLLRMGTCSGFQPDINPGDIMIFDSAARFEGTTHRYVGPEYPAVAHHEIIMSAVKTAEKLNLPYHVGTSRCTDACFANLPVNKLNQYRLHEWDSFIPDLIEGKIIGGDMESSAVMVLSRLFGIRGGALCVCMANLAKQTDAKEAGFNNILYGGTNIDRLNRVALETMYQIYLHDQTKNSEKKKAEL